MFDYEAPFFVLSDGHLNVFYREKEAEDYYRFSEREGRDTSIPRPDDPVAMRYSDGRLQTYTLYNKNMIQRNIDGEVVLEIDNNWIDSLLA